MRFVGIFIQMVAATTNIVMAILVIGICARARGASEMKQQHNSDSTDKQTIGYNASSRVHQTPEVKKRGTPSVRRTSDNITSATRQHRNSRTSHPYRGQ